MMNVKQTEQWVDMSKVGQRNMQQFKVHLDLIERIANWTQVVETYMLCLQWF